MRLILIIFFSIFLVVIGLLTTRFWGLGQNFVEFDHPFLKQKYPVYFVRATNVSEIRQTQLACGACGFWLDLRVSKDGAFLVLPRIDLSKLLNQQNLGDHYVGNKINYYSRSDLLKLESQILDLNVLLSESPKANFILNIVDNVDNVHQLLDEYLKNFPAKEQYLIQSDTENVLKSMREIQPRWLYGTSYSELMRLLSFESLYVLPASPLKADILISPLKIFKRPAVTKPIVEEARRRLKKVFLGPLDYKDYTQVATWSVDGYIAENIIELEKILNDKTKNLSEY